MSALVADSTTVGELREMLARRYVTSVKLRLMPSTTQMVYPDKPAETRHDLTIGAGSCVSDRGASRHSTNLSGRYGVLTLAEALSALLSEIPIVGGDHGQ